MGGNWLVVCPVIVLWVVAGDAVAEGHPTLQRSEQYYVEPGIMNQAQVTAVADFLDVQPTDWAFLALQSLVERYGCIGGYPTHPAIYQGQRPITRYEFAAGLHACLERVNGLLKTAVEPFVTQEDLVILQKLQAEFAAELAMMRGRVDALDARTATLEAQQFSTVTKLRSEIILAAYGVNDAGIAYNRIENALLRGNRRFTGATSAGATRGVVIPGAPFGVKASAANQLALGYRVRMNFNTSLTGTDLLRLRLQTGDLGNLNGATGTNQTRLGFDNNNGGNVIVDKLEYRFSFQTGRGRVTIAGLGMEPDDFFDVYTPISSPGSGAISRFGRYNPLFYRIGGNAGTGVFMDYQFRDGVQLGASFLGNHPATGGIPGTSGSGFNPDLGLFGSNYTVNVLLGLEPRRDFKFGLGYVHSYSENVTQPGGTAAAGINLSGSTGTDLAVNPFNPAGTPGLAPLSRTGVQFDTINLMFQWQALPQFILAGWFSYGWVRGQSDAPALPAQGTRQANILTTALQFIFPNPLGRTGDRVALILGIPPYVRASRWNGGTLGTGNNIPAGVAGAQKLNLRDTAMPVHFEGFYLFQVNRFMSITPGAFVVLNPNGQASNNPLAVYTVRTTFSF
ncbi:carbohydrate-selective porin OprB [Gloeomargarita lithophora Alchichica-D10]|uniref:Carbohydrate-selective porin OprB n=1 Tax=Gloeomargarita lithophora Alchichica-D10 TaxID=1188229 RepID=A0A1J0AEH3_9CYAN|nr:iron uptake porin [Gloeomargarita lithophora]APB34311.1 carbohydrate-selective porin OprB [Gloeomargarita lithophora Alchichica-D10]